jgi:hypothetical protein
VRDVAGNVPPLPGVFPDYPAPIVRTGSDGVRELAMARWGMPTPPKFLEGKKTDKGVTNVRNVSSPHWRRWLAIGNRCVVPFNSFSENAPMTFEPVWFALNEPSAGLLRRHLDAMDIGAEGQGRRDEERHFRLSDDDAECRGLANTPQGDARHPDDARRC